MDKQNGYPDTTSGLGYRFDHGGCLYGQETRQRVERLERALSKAIWVVVPAALASVAALANTVLTMASKGP